MSNYPHIKNNVLLVLENCNLTYLDESDGGCSLVVRLAPTKNLPLRFEKQGRIINGRIDDQVSHEEQVFREIKNKEQSGNDIKKVVNRIEYIQRNDNYVLITKDTGIDVDIWQNISLYLRNNKRSYQNIFCHPLVLLHFIKGTLLAFQNIHQVGLYHCDIKGDQICIPFIKDGNMIVVNPDDVSLIDFGIAIWEMTPVASRNPVRFTSQNISNGDYVATTLIEAGNYQNHLYQTTGKYDFNQLINQIDCAVDLYSFGFLLHSLEITQYPEDRQAWRSFFNKYQKWIDELLALSDQKTPFKNNLPHNRYIKQIDSWIGGVNEILDITVNQLVFEIKDNNRDSTPPVRSRPTPTPTPVNNEREENPNPSVTPPAIENNVTQEEISFWADTISKNTISAYLEYVGKYPKGNFVGDANKNIVELTKAEDEQEGKLWKDACIINTVDSYNRYLKISKKRKFVLEARKSIVDLEKRLEENALWNKALSDNSIETYKEYLKKYPKGMYIKTANDRILEISENIFWQTICQKNEISGYESYIKEFPNGKFFKTAQQAISVLEYETADFNECCKIDTLESCYAYLKKYPHGKFVKRIQDRIENFKKHESLLDKQNSREEFDYQQKDDEIELWNTVSEKDEIAGYEEYLNKYPNGEFIWRAKGRINSLKQIGSEKQPQNNSSSHTKNTNTDQKSNIQSQNDEIKRKMLLDDFSKYQKKDILINKVQVWLILFSCSIYPNMIYNKFSLLGLFIVGLTMLPLLIDIFIQVNKLKISVLSYFSLNREGALLFTTMLLITSSLIMGMINNNGYQEFPHFKVDGHYGTSIILIFFGGFIVFNILQEVVEKSMRLGSYLAQSQFFTKNNPNPKIQVARENGIVLKGELICKINDISYYAEQDGYLHIMDGLYKGLENYIFIIHRLHKWDK